VLPTFYAASGLTFTDLVISLSIFLLIYSVLAVIEVILMVKTIKKGPLEHDPLQPTIAGPDVLPITAAAGPKL
jgi:cytochrome d ubiquinol oxidase subunit I